MSILTVVYILLLMGGIVWLVLRISAYLQREREREARISESYFYDDQFKTYLEKLKAQNQVKRESDKMRETVD